MKLNSKSKILSISHCDLDGVGCQIALGNFFSNIEYHAATFTSINHIVKTLSTKFKNYDCVIITDIYPKDLSILDSYDNVVVLDHHETNKSHDPDKNRFVITDFCAAQLTKNWVEAMFNVDLSFLDDFMDLVNDYDLWIHKDPKSKQMNMLYGYYRHNKTLKRFFNGDVNFSPRENQYLKERQKEFENIWDQLNVYDLEKINGCFFTYEDFPNELCEKLYSKGKEGGYDVVFAYNINNNNISVRTGRTDINLGEVLEDLEVGGGHPCSASCRGISSLSDVPLLMEMVEKEMYKRWPQVRRKWLKSKYS